MQAYGRCNLSKVRKEIVTQLLLKEMLLSFNYNILVCVGTFK